MFDSLRMGDYVRWTPRLRSGWYKLPEAGMWEDEPDCAMEVCGIDHSSEDACVELECVNSCGAHFMTSISRDDYEEAAIMLGGDLLEQVNFSDLTSGLLTGVPVGYDFDEDQEAIYQMLQEGTLY